MIHLQHISKVYQIGEVKIPALQGVSLQIEEGCFMTISGRSGCGKTTLMNILGALDEPTQGVYHFEGQAVHAMKGRELARFRNKCIGYVFQSFNLLPHLNSLENVALPLGYAGYGRKDRRQMASEALERVGLGHRLSNKPTQLSGGEQQRVAIARAIVNKPRVILADEPTGNLDLKNSEEVMRLLLDLHQSGTSLILITHDPAIAEQGQRQIVMEDGLVISDERLEKSALRKPEQVDLRHPLRRGPLPARPQARPL